MCSGGERARRGQRAARAALGAALALYALALAGPLGCAAGPGAGAAPLGAAEAAAALRETLRLGVERTAVRTARRGGFSGDPALRIALPPGLAPTARALRAAGMGWTLEELESAMNRAAELAAAEARPLLLEAVSGLALPDARGLLRGPEDAATRHLERSRGARLRERLEPEVARALEQVDLARIERDLSARANTLGVVEDPALEIDAYVLDRIHEGLFAVLAQEERRIRKEPAARTTPLLRRAFGAR